jgi:adenosylcobinamide-GDP ribazoletransferase
MPRLIRHLTGFARHYLLAVQFFTRIPVTGRLAAWVGFSPAMLRASAAHFPGVGWIVAAVTGALATGSLLAWPTTAHAPLLAAVLCTAAGVWLTGGFHEDGLADVADGLGGHVDRARALEIMKDSRIGAYGAMALVLALMAKVAVLSMLAAHGIPTLLAALAGAHVLSRWCPLVIVRSLPHVGDTAQSKSKPLADQITNSTLAAAAAWCVLPLALTAATAGPAFLAAAMGASGLALWWTRRLLARRLQGFTGDGLGATQQLCEIAFYLGAALTLRA